MITKQILGILINIGVLGLLVLYLKYGLNRKAKVKESGDVLETEILVKGVYSPNVIEAKKGQKLKINFKRDEDVSCSEYVVMPDFKVRKRLPAFETTVVEFTPEKEGEYEFTCSMGMYRGKIIVK